MSLRNATPASGSNELKPKCTIEAFDRIGWGAQLILCCGFVGAVLLTGCNGEISPFVLSSTENVTLPDSETGGTTDSNVDSETGSGPDTDSVIDAGYACTGVYDLPGCMEEVSGLGGGTIQLVDQTYLLTETLTLADNVNLVGQGAASVITWEDSIKETVDAPLLSASGLDNVSLENFTIECHIDQDVNSSDLRNAHIGLSLLGEGDPTGGEPTDMNNIFLRGLEIFHCSYGVQIVGGTDIEGVDLRLHHNGNTEVDLFHNAYFRKIGNLILRQTSPTSGGYYGNPRGHGIFGAFIINVYFENLSIYENADHGIHVDNVYNMRLHNMDVHDNCLIPEGACGDIKCYQYCEVDWEAPQE